MSKRVIYHKLYNNSGSNVVI